MPDLLLSQRLNQAVSPEFFRPLTRATSSIYIDCAHRLQEEAGLSGRLPLHEAQQIIREVLAKHSNLKLEEDEGSNIKDPRQRASFFLNRLLSCGWLEEQTLGLQDRRIIITPGLRLLLTMMGSLVEDQVEELHTFADTLRGICETFELGNTLRAESNSGETLRSAITDLNIRLDVAISQLYSVEKLIASYELRQRNSESAAETLRLFYREFSKGQHMACYDVLSKGGLLSRLRGARAKVSDLRDDPLTLDRLTEGYAEHYGYEQAEAAFHAKESLSRLERGLGGLGEIATAIDERMAAFNRLSQQRYRYQTDVRGRRPELVKNYCDALNNNAEPGARFRDFANQPADFQPFTLHARFFYGIDALWRSRGRRAPTDLSYGGGRATREDEEAALEAMRQRQRLALTPHRAAKLVSRIAQDKGEKLSTDRFQVQNTDELLDLLALVAYDHGQDERGKTIRWAVQSDRRQHGLEPEKVIRDPQQEWMVDRFDLTRTK